MSIAAVATRTQKTENQDSVALVESHHLPLTGVVVADGLGSHYGCEVAARAATAAAVSTLADTRELEHVNIPALFRCARTAIERVVQDQVDRLPKDVSLDASFGTTLIVGLDLPDRLRAGYVGNGAILHLRGDFHQFPSTMLLPWTLVNLLNPHARMVDGTAPLYKWLGPRTNGLQSSPSLVDIGKDDTAGDVLIVCSDGICSLDHMQIGTDSIKRAWIRLERSIALLYVHLREFVESGELTSQALGDRLECYLSTLEQEQEMTDDCSIGVIITGAAARRFEARRLAGAVLL